MKGRLSISLHLQLPGSWPSSSSNMATFQTVLPKESNSTAIIILTEPPFKLSHKQLFQQSLAFQEKLAATGIAPGDAVAIVLSNSLELVISFLATSFQGAICAPLNPAYKQDEFDFYVIQVNIYSSR